MKKLLSLSIIMLFSLSSIFAKERVSPHTTVKGKNVSVTYGQPYKKGREIFGALEAYGKVWRTGADEATEITFDKNGTFGGQQVKAGTYSLFTIPGKDEWTIILNSQLKQWGAFEYDSKKDVLRVTAKTKHLDKVVEQFTISLDNSMMKLDWDQTSVTVWLQF